MVQFRASLWRFCLLSLPLASALTLPQKVLSEGDGVYELSNDDLTLNVTEVQSGEIAPFTFTSSNARSCDNFDPVNFDYDVAIIGGGPAGLAASMSLGRVARTSLMYDSGEYRNGKTRYMHDVLGQDGKRPLDFRIAVRGQIDMHYSDYSKRATSGLKVTAIQPLTKGFRIWDENEGKINVRKVILATGITDIMPKITGFDEAFGRGLFWCPWCDGFDYKGRAMTIISKPGNFPGAIASALAMSKLTSNIKIVASVNTKLDDAERAATEARWPGWEKTLKTYGIDVYYGVVSKIERTAKGGEPSDDEYKITKSGSPSTFVTNGILYSTSTKQTSSLHKQLHLQMDGSSIKVADNMESSMGGVFAVGDAKGGSTNAYHAMWSAKRAVVNIHSAINKEDYLDKVPATMVMAEGGDEEFYQRQIDELNWQMDQDILEMAKIWGA
ncbi:hypothetical protein N7532_011794 [Penicillium argentinense]|uniref:FAD/NAD(P)-binding domain-containing protein n=1 Tax=Penicillium argentinense TaxID=1131581 RepID=A0A9W9EJC6_9EURO|nr:uncharacterized protein N7532_011794 [Penicillium argentinense]KAJ5082751.1 hypothetical protein N7532_011794 [Penicillium argentinense]